MYCCKPRGRNRGEGVFETQKQELLSPDQHGRTHGKGGYFIVSKGRNNAKL